MEDNKSNIIIFGKQEEQKPQSPVKHLEPVVTEPAVLKKKSKTKKLLDDFAIEDTKKVKLYLWSSVIRPSIKNFIWNFFTNGLKMFLYRDGDGPNTTVNSAPAEVPRINYATMYKYATPQVYTPPRTAFNYGEVIMPTWAKADEVLRALRNLVAEVGVATIGNLYEAAKLPTEFVDFTYGWRDLSSAQIIPVDGGYLISLPRPYPVSY